jgi:hypothetical protein
MRKTHSQENKSSISMPKENHSKLSQPSLINLIYIKYYQIKELFYKLLPFKVISIYWKIGFKITIIL